jgi:hypothetical protein
MGGSFCRRLELGLLEIIMVIMAMIMIVMMVVVLIVIVIRARGLIESVNCFCNMTRQA